MSKQEKLLKRLLSRPKDFTWNELIRLLNSYGFELLKGNGSRRKFCHPESKLIISLHEPHPQNTIKQYAIDIVINSLKEQGIVND